jgi:hypothetical protein
MNHGPAPLYLAMLCFTAILWFIPIISIVSFLIGITARLVGASVYQTRVAITTTLWWPYLAFNVALALLGAWWSLSWW